MPNFATETDVRESFQMTDTVTVPAYVITRSITNAHAQILRRLYPEYNTIPPDPELAFAETMLAGALAMRTLAYGAANGRRKIVVGGQRIEPSKRDTKLGKLADAVESQAWDLLEPFLFRLPPRRVIRITESIVLLGRS